MADPKYGGSKGDLDKAIAATNAQAAQSIERKARAQGEDARATDAESTAEERNVRSRKAAASAVEEQSAALEATTSRLAAESAAINANTQAWIRNAQARAGAGAEAALGGRYGGVTGDLTGAIAQTEAQARAVENLDQKAQGLARTGRQLDLFSAAGTQGLFGRQPANAVTGPPRLREVNFNDPASQARLANAFSFPAARSSAGANDTTKVESYSRALSDEQRVTELEAAARARSNELLQRSVGAYAASSQSLQRHGALTAEFIQGLVRGEVTLKEFQSQLTITIGKFAGWAVAGGLVYGAYDAIKHLFDGLKETETGVAQLRRSLGQKVDAPLAAEGFRRVGRETNSTIREVADAQFYASRVFHDQADSLALAGTALRAYRLDQVNTQEAIKSLGAVSIAFGVGPKQLAATFDQLDVGQLKFNARLNQTLPQVGRASASFAAAGGTLKQLVDQVIQINRATGGSGGSGGGNPATALLREPANLQRPETEEVLRRYNINPKFAQQNIGAFNQLVQERRHSGQYDEHAIQEIAKAAGAGPGVGFRYLLPLFRLGRTDIPAEERRATEHAGGSAKEDLEHRLEQADEQVRKIGIDFEQVGSQLASIGFGPALVDVLHGIDLLGHGVGFVLDPLARLGSIISSLPGPVRALGEAFLAFAAVRRLSASNVGLTARQLAGESSFFPHYGGGGVGDLRAVQATQSKYLEYLTNQRETQSVAQLTAGRRAQDLEAQLAQHRAEGAAGGVGVTSSAAYADRSLILEQRLLAAQQAQEDAATAGAALESEITSVKTRLLALEDRKVAVSERLALAQSEGLYAAQLGSPNALPLLAPREGIPREVRTPGGIVLPPGAGGAGPLAALAERQGAALNDAATGAAEQEAAVGSATLRNGGLFIAADAALQRTGERIATSFTGIKSFIGNLGLLGKGIAAFIALDAINRIAGGEDVFAKAQSALGGIAGSVSEASSAQEVTAKLAEAKKRLGEGNGVGATFHDIISGFGLFGETTGANLLGGPGSGPGTNESLRKAIARYEKEIRKGGLGGLGGKGQLSQQFSEVAEAAEYNAAGGLEAGQSEKTIQKVEAQIAAKLKLRIDELKAFGAGPYSSQVIQQLGYTSTGQGERYSASGDSQVFENLAKNDETIVQGVVSAMQEHLQLAVKLGNTSQIEAAARQAKGVFQATISQLAVKLSKAAELIEQAEATVGGDERQLGAAKTPAERGKLSKKLEEARKQLGQQHERYGKLRDEYETNAQTLLAAEAGVGQEAFTGAVSPLRAKENLTKARAGANKQAGAEADLKLVIEEEGKANNLLTGKDKKEELLALQAKRIAAEEAVVTEKIGTLRAHGAREIAELPIGDTVGKARLETDIDRRVEQLIRRSNLSPKSKAKQLEEAHTATLTAQKQLEEAIYQEASAIANLQTQIAQARDAGNAAAQAQDALRGAQRLAGLAKTPQERLQAQLDTINAINQARQAQQQRISAEGELAEAQTGDPLKQAQIKVRTDRRLLGTAAGPDEAIKDRAALANDIRRAGEARVSAREEEIDFHLQMQQISQQQAIDQYNNLLKLHGLTTRTRRDILTKIRALQGELGNNPVYDLSPTSIKLPTAYDVHRAILTATRNTAGGVTHNGDVTQVNQFTITVHDQKDVGKVADVLDRALGSGVKARLRAAGLRGN